jgi:hypothetical protein
MTCALVERLETIADPRRQGENLKHPLVDIIILGFCGVLGGCDDFVEIAEWAKVHEVFFRSFLKLPHGIPAHDTFNRVCAMLKPTTLQEVLLPWLLERARATGRLDPPGWENPATYWPPHPAVASLTYGECVGGANRAHAGASGRGREIQ